MPPKPPAVQKSSSMVLYPVTGQERPRRAIAIQGPLVKKVYFCHTMSTVITTFILVLVNRIFKYFVLFYLESDLGIAIVLPG